MDVMKPDVYRIGRRFYRRNPLNLKFLSTSGASYQPYEEEDPSEFRRCLDEGEAGAELGGDLQQLDNGSWRLSLPLPPQLFPSLIGRRAETKKRLEVDTRTTLTVPRQGQTGPVLVSGRERDAVLTARGRIALIVEAARERLPFSHFLSVPVAQLAPDVKTAFEDFRARVLDLCGGDRGISDSLFQSPEKLHLTLGVLSLLDEREVEAAVKELQDSQAELKEMLSEPLVVDFVGLEYMNDDPSEVDVLYMKIDDVSGRFQLFVDRLVDRFVAKGLMRRQYDSVKLHVTLMNTLFRRDPGSASGTTQGRGRPVRESFDASGLLSRFRDFQFAQKVTVSSVHLSQRYSTGQDGYYTCVASMSL